MKLDVKTATGADAGTVDVPDELFGIEPNVAVMHQVVTAQLAAARAGTHSTKTRAEVARRWCEAVAPEGHRPRPPGLDPRAALAWRRRGPRPEAARLPPAHAQEDDPARAALGAVRPRRRGQGARRRRLGHRRRPAPRTRSTLLGALGLRTAGRARRPRCCSCSTATEEAVWKSFRNLGERVQIVLPDELNTYDVLVNDWLVFSRPRSRPRSRASDGAAERHRRRAGYPGRDASDDRAGADAE